MKLLCAGGRDLWMTTKGFEFLDFIIHAYDITEIVQGGAKGIDTAAKQWAFYRDIDITTMLAEWDLYGKRAGPIRNEKMVQYCKKDYAVYFQGGVGTAGCFALACENMLGSHIFNKMSNQSLVRGIKKNEILFPCSLCNNPICTGLTCVGMDNE